MRTICDQLAWFERGKLRMVGDAGDVIDHYVAEVQTDRHDDAGDDGVRWGSGEALIERIEVLRPDDRSTSKLQTGDAVTFRVHYRAPQRVERPVFGLAFYNLEGVLVSGPNTREAEVVPDFIEGEGTMDLTVDALMLLPGTYDISASLYDYAIVHPFDFRQRAVRFDVDPGTPHETFGGVMSLNGRWTTEPGSGS
jgi:ABC-2 type transport system ATP-binding protein